MWGGMKEPRAVIYWIASLSPARSAGELNETFPFWAGKGIWKREEIWELRLLAF